MGLNFEEEEAKTSEDVLTPVLNSFVKYRDDIRLHAKNNVILGIKLIIYIKDIYIIIFY